MKSNEKVIQQYSFCFDETINFSTNIIRLTNLLSYKNINLFTDKDFNPNDVYSFLFPERFYIKSITILGQISYLKFNLSESYEKIKKGLEVFVNSEADLEYKIRELQLSRIAIKEFIITSNIYKPAMMADSFSADLFNPKFESQHIMFSQCDLSQEAINQWAEHQEVRMYYMELLDSIFALELDKLFLFPLDYKTNESNKEKEVKLLEVWIALKQAGFLSHLSDKDISNQRKMFFELFNLKDNNYNDRNKAFKIKKYPRAVFLTELVKYIENYK